MELATSRTRLQNLQALLETLLVQDITPQIQIESTGVYKHRAFVVRFIGRIISNDRLPSLLGLQKLDWSEGITSDEISILRAEIYYNRLTKYLAHAE